MRYEGDVSKAEDFAVHLLPPRWELFVIIRFDGSRAFLF